MQDIIYIATTVVHVPPEPTRTRRARHHLALRVCRWAVLSAPLWQLRPRRRHPAIFRQTLPYLTQQEHMFLRQIVFTAIKIKPAFAGFILLVFVPWLVIPV